MNLSGGRGDYQGVENVRRDALLVVQAQLGDRRALAELVRLWHDPLWRYVRRMLNGPGRAWTARRIAAAASLGRKR
ncbi:hypothetical protein Rhe02_33210 [Rhizocola hellebori]|uniref:Uncharacterized protein n=1 Tax=Rhizocola hellebori TaxID=1392758 RepID=A0A8J3Q899_9ACTN|nr:hypothetical protein Rhe02_33210 [Rhizocola hellebori]